MKPPRDNTRITMSPPGSDHFLLENMTYPEVSRRIAEGDNRVIVPLGATEQHGPGLPLCVDTLHAMETVLRAVRHLQHTLVAPAVPFGYSPEHRAFAGTHTLQAATLESLLRDIADSLARSGFVFIYFWLGHGGNWPLVEQCFGSGTRLSTGCRVAFPRDMGAYTGSTWDKVPGQEGIPLSASGSHAGEFEASMLAAMRPDLLRREHLAKGDPRPFPEIVEQMMTEGIHTVSPNGVLGDQRQADADRGNRYLEAIAAWLVDDFKRQFNEQSP